jgi:hypothetical protein
MTAPSVGALTALAFVLIIGDAERFHCGKQARANCRNIPITLIDLLGSPNAAEAMEICTTAPP